MKDGLTDSLKKAIALVLLINRSQDAHSANILPIDGAKFEYKEGVLTVDKTALDRLRELLIDDEGLELKPYKDSRGILTIGVGRNLENVGISEREALIMLDNDIKRVLLEAQRALPFFDQLNSTRQVVVLSMVFNMGITAFLQFKKMIAALQNGDYNLACKEMMNSEWSKQVGQRSRDLSVLMKLGHF